MLVVFQFQPTAQHSVPVRILIGGRADWNVNVITQVDVRAPANQNASKGAGRSRLKLKHHRHEVGGLLRRNRKGRPWPKFDTASLSGLSSA